MKTKILSLAVIAGVFTGCSQFNLPTLPQPQAMGINHELIKDIKTDGKGGYYVMEREDCEKLLKAGAFVNKRYVIRYEIDYCYDIAQDNIRTDAINASFDEKTNCAKRRKCLEKGISRGNLLACVLRPSTALDCYSPCGTMHRRKG